MKLTELMLQIRNADFSKELLKSCELYFVGGAVRDLIVGKDPKDIDIVCCGITEYRLVEVLSKYGRVDLVGESFGCFKFKPFAFKVDEAIDFALARKERKVGNGHKGFEMVCDSSFTILDDLGRRDFTINSIAVSLRHNEVIDPFDGMLDITDQEIRCVNVNAFIEDPLRIVRALQFAARFNFYIEANTLKMMKDNKHLLAFTNKDCLAGERIFDEIKKVWDKKGKLLNFINLSAPFIASMFGTNHNTTDCTVMDNQFGLFEDFLFIISAWANVEAMDFLKALKVDNDCVKRMECILEMTHFDIEYIISNCHKDYDEELVRLYKKDKGSLDSLYCPYYLKDRLNHARINNLPLSLKELNKNTGINGSVLMEKGFKGIELGEELQRILLQELRKLD